MSRDDTILDLSRRLRDGGLTRREFVTRALALGLSLSAAGTLLAACGEEEEEPAAGGATLPPMDETIPEEIVVFNWADYIAPSVRKAFETEYGIKVKEAYFDNNEAMLAKLKAGATGYDIAVPTSYTASILIKSDMVDPLDPAYLPNMQYTLPAFQDPPYDPGTDGLSYTVPYMWGTAGYCLRTDILDDPITKWADLWNTKYENEISMMFDERECMGAALKLLGYSLNTTDEAEINEAADKLIEQKPLVQKYVITNSYREIVAGKAPITHCWNGEVALAVNNMGEGSEKNVRYVFPDEGFSTWVDTLVIPKGGNSRYGAHLFMDFLMRPEVSAENALWIGYLPVSEEALETVKAENPVAEMIIPTEAEMERAEVLSDVGEAARLYTDAWQRVVAA
jgi:spermidine/putrescine transport system substrate-binding protein